MSSASTSTLVRYRPAILAISAIAAGYTIYYLHSSFWSSAPLEGSRRLHRSNAVHRRARQAQPDQPWPSELLNRVDVTAANLMLLWHQSSPAFESHSTEIGAPFGLTRTNFARLETREAISPSEEAQRIRAENETALITSFLCGAMPPNAFLIDTGGHSAFVRAFQDLGFRNETSISVVLTDWNLGNLDHRPERQGYYTTRNITPPPYLAWRDIPPEALVFSHDPSSSNEHLYITRTQTFGAAEALRTASIGEFLRDSETQEEVDMESEHSWREEDENDDTRKEGQSLLNMLYHIAEDQSRREGYVHRQVSCNSCGTIPIRGIRYRCSNCADYDLCEQCEAMQIHPKTHLFFKIRVPAPFFDNTQRPQPVRYPGRLTGLPNHLPRHVSKQLSQDAASELSEIEALWDQFKCLATTYYSEDSLGLHMAIDRDVFDKCFLPSTVSIRRPPSMPIHDRIFSFFDTNNDDLIGFHEFVMGIATIRTRDKDMKLQRTFNLYDLDQDGYVNRKDFLRMHRSFYALTKDFTHDMIQNMEEEVLEGASLQENLLGTQPISSAYTGSIPPSNPRRPQEGKSRDIYGDYIVTDRRGVISENDAGLGNLHEIIGDMSEKDVFGDIYDPVYPEPIVSGAEKDHPLAKEPWPPHYVRNMDVAEALGKEVPLMEVTNLADRHKIVQVAVSRRERVRQDGVQRHRERRAFYEDELVKDTGLKSNGTASRSSPHVYDADLHSRIPPPLEDDGGQEYLYQILQQSLNELLDPLFKQREDLALEAAKSHNERQILRRQLDEFGGSDMRRLCHFQINNFELVWRIDQVKDELGVDADMGVEITRLIATQEEQGSGQYYSNMKNMVMFKVMDAEEYGTRVGMENKPTPRATANSKSKKETDDNSDSSKLEEFLAQKEKELGSDAFTWPNSDPNRMATESARDDGIEVLVEQRSSQAQNGQSYDLVESSTVVPDAVIAENETSEFQRAAQELESALCASSTFLKSVEEIFMGSGVSAIHSTDWREYLLSLKSGDASLDPTMPQNKPNSSIDPTPVPFINYQPTSISPLPPRPGELEEDGSRKRRQHLKYLLMMDCLEEEDRARNGAGKLGYEEFQQIMKGPRGGRLDFLGVFYSMVNY